MHQPSLPTPLTHSIGWSGAAAVIAGAAMGAPAGARVACALSSWLPGPGGCVPAGALVGALLALGALPLLGQGTRRGESAAHRPAPTTTTAARLVWLAIAAALGRWLAQGLLHPQLVIRVGPPSPAVALHMLDSLGPIADIPAGFRTRSGDLRVAHLSAQAIEIDGQLEALCTILDSRDPTSAERRAAAGEELVRILTGTASPEPARAALQAIGECLHWELGVLWRVDPMAEQLTCEAAWRWPLAELGALEESRWRGGFSPGNGLPGRIWQASQAAWITDLAEEAELGDGAGTDEGADGEAVHGWFGFPVVVGDEVLGVVEFFSSEERQVDPELVQMTARFGRLFGRLLGGAEQQEEADKEEGPGQEGAAGQERFLDAAAADPPNADQLLLRELVARVARVNEMLEAIVGPDRTDPETTVPPAGSTGERTAAPRSRSRGALTLKVLSELTGVPPGTLRTWERRYGFTHPSRSAAGYRQYGEADVARVLQIKQLWERGVRIGEAVQVISESVADILPEDPSAVGHPPPNTSNRTGVTSVAGRLLGVAAACCLADRWFPAGGPSPTGPGTTASACRPGSGRGPGRATTPDGAQLRHAPGAAHRSRLLRRGLRGPGRRRPPVPPGPWGHAFPANPVDIVSTIARPPFGPNMAAMQADATAAARSATARSNSRLGFVTSH